MNTLLVTPFFSPQTGGVATYLEDLRRFLAERGHRVYVLRAGDSDKITPCRLNPDNLVFEYSMRPLWVPNNPIKGLVAFLVYFLPTLWILTAFIRRKRIQLISLEYPLAYMLYFRLVRLWTGVKLIVGLHGDDVLSLHLTPRHEQWMVRQMIRRADWVLAHSSSLMSHAQQIVGHLGSRYSYLPYGIDVQQLRARARNGYPRTALVRSPYILTVAKLYPRKGLDILLYAIKKISVSNSDYCFMIVGDGPEEGHLRELAAGLGIEHLVVFAGDVPYPEVPGLFRDCEFFVLPSRSEPFGIVLLEAMTFGKAVLATQVGGIPEFVTDAFNGLLVPSEDSDALAEKIDLLIHDPYLRSSIGKNGVTTVESRYDYRVLVSQYESLFRSLTKQAA